MLSKLSAYLISHESPLPCLICPRHCYFLSCESSTAAVFQYFRVKPLLCLKLLEDFNFKYHTASASGERGTVIGRWAAAYSEPPIVTLIQYSSTTVVLMARYYFLLCLCFSLNLLLPKCWLKVEANLPGIMLVYNICLREWSPISLPICNSWIPLSIINRPETADLQFACVFHNRSFACLLHYTSTPSFFITWPTLCCSVCARARVLSGYYFL